MGRPKQEIELSTAERNELQRLSRRARSNRHVALRAKMILASADGLSDVAVAAKLRVSNVTVGTWRKRFAQRRIDGLYDEPRSGAPRKISDSQIEAIVLQTIESTPAGHRSWSTRNMARKVGLSHSSIARIWRAHGLKPHLTPNHQRGSTQIFSEHMQDLAGLYVRDNDRVAAFILQRRNADDIPETSLPQVLDVKPGERHATPLTHTLALLGQPDTAATKTNIDELRTVDQDSQEAHRGPIERARAFEVFLRELDEKVPERTAVHLVLNGLSLHKIASIRRWLFRNPRFHVHFAPGNASWIAVCSHVVTQLAQRSRENGANRALELVHRPHRRGPLVWLKCKRTRTPPSTGHTARADNSGQRR